MKRYVAFALTSAVLILLAGHGTVQAQTWIELNPTGSALPLVDKKTIHYDAATNRLIVFIPGNPAVGGAGNQVWVLTNANGLGGTPEWIQLLPAGSPPFSNGLESVVYDSLTNRLIVYGGCYANCAPALNGVFVLTNANGLGGPPVWSQSTVTNPQARTYHSGVYDPSSNRLITFGGQLAYFGTDQNDTRVLTNGNGVTSPSIWITLPTAGNLPAIRNYHTTIYDEVNNRMTIFAGTNYISHCPSCTPQYFISDHNDVWVLADANGLGTPTWTQLSPAGSLPSPRSGHSAVYDPVNNRMLVFGGLSWNQATQDHTRLGDLWQLSHADGLGGAPTWTQISPTGTPPGPRFNHAAAFDAANQRMIVLDGSDQIGITSNRVWVLIENTPPVAGTPVKFTTNETVGTPGPYRVQNITVYVDDVLKCFTDSNGDCNGQPLGLAAGLHKARYVWATCSSNPDSCPHYGEVTHYINVPDQTGLYPVRIPTARVRWYTPNGDNRNGTAISLNGVFLGDPPDTAGTFNVMGGCYTASYSSPNSQPPGWPNTIPGIPESDLKGFNRVCFGSADKYPAPTPDDANDTNPPHVRITVPASLWP